MVTSESPEKKRYKQYRCWRNDPLSCEFALVEHPADRQAAPQPGAEYCQKCRFPATLTPKAEIRGYRGRYRVEQYHSQRGMGRLYRGIRLSDGHPVVIKEYLLPEKSFNRSEAHQRQQAFLQLAGVSLADGRVQDFRLLTPWDVIADNNQERCYLVTWGDLDACPTLSQYLTQNGPMAVEQVRQVLNQVLQTLESLHGQKFRLPHGKVPRGFAHGNLSLDSLLIVKNQEPKGLFSEATEVGLPDLPVAERTDDLPGQQSGDNVASTQIRNCQFSICLGDLALWERLFDPPEVPISNLSAAADLVALGYVSFYLLAGRTVNSDGLLLDPLYDREWPPIDRGLKLFILRLMGLIDAPFASAEIARQALLKLPKERQVARTDGSVVPADLEKRRNFRLLRLLFWLLLGTLLITLIWLLVQWLLKLQPKTQTDIQICCIKDVAGIPDGNFTYTSESKGTWNYVLQQPNLVLKDKTFEQLLQEHQPELHLTYTPEPSTEDAIAQVNSKAAEFAIASLTSDDRSAIDLGHQEVAYDGIAVFVAFSYSERKKGLPKFLNGQITFEQLRQLYAGKIKNWKELNGPDLPVKLYIPDDPETVKIFEKRVLKKVGFFDSMPVNQSNADSFTKTGLQTNQITSLSTFPELRQILRDFESESESQAFGAIGFDTFSKISGQCSVYPLALADGSSPPVQALVEGDGTPVKPETNLCNDKGNYRPDVRAFTTGSYPLAYPLAVIYPEDNSRPPVGRKFAEILQTREGQCLLSKTGMVPLQPLPERFNPECNFD